MKESEPIANIYDNTILNNLYILKILIKISPMRVIGTLLDASVRYFGWVFYMIIFTRYILRSLDEQIDFKQITLFIAFSMVIFLLFELFTAWFNQKYKPISDQEIYYKMNRILFDKASSVDISCFENPDFYNNYTIAMSEAKERAILVLESMANLIVSTLSSIYVIYTMFTLDKFIGLLAVVPVIGSFVFGKVLNQLKYQNDLDDVPFNRQSGYVNRVVFLQKYAKEIRLSKVYHILVAIYEASYIGILKNVDKYKKKSFSLGFVQGIICYPAIFEGVWIYAIYRALVLKNLSVADCVVLANAMVAASNMLLAVMGNVLKISENGLYIKNFRVFLNYREKISENQEGCLVEGNVHTLEFKNVSFIYDGQTKPILQNINIKINSNEKIALVGHNGAGKTTLVKLMMRLYDVTEGEILLNGINIKDYNLKEYRKLFGTVFQDHQILSMSALENVCMSEISNEDQRNTGIDAMKKSGIYEKLMSLKNGLDTVLTREFDEEGAVLSGGELQKIAIARIFANSNSIIVLDEPSSALDPIAEFNMYETFTKTFGDQEQSKMVVLISHRLSSAVLADKVYVFENGKVVEQGSHEELIKTNGKYGDMFRKQAKNYIDEKVHLKMKNFYDTEGEAVC